jgi:hypothetical protein
MRRQQGKERRPERREPAPPAPPQRDPYAFSVAIGNHAMARLAAAHRLQRLAIDVTTSGPGKHDRVTSVSYDTSRTPGNIAGHDGDHTTAFVTFKSMVRNTVMGKTIAEAKTALTALLDEVMLFPGASIKVRGTEYLFNKADAIKEDIRAVSDDDTLAEAMRSIVEIRNELGMSAQLNSTSSGGHGEAGNNALVEECDDRLRRQGPALRYTPAQLVDSMWQLLDYHPKDSADDERIVATVAQHLYSMGVTYPHVFAAVGDEGLIPGVSCGNRRHFFYDEMIRALRRTPGIVFDDITANRRINALVRAVEDALRDGAASLAPIGASKRYVEHLESH